MSDSIFLTNNMTWDSPPNYGSLTNHEAEIQGVMASWPRGQATSQGSATNPDALNAVEEQILLGLQKIRLEREEIDLQRIRLERQEIELQMRLLQIRTIRQSTQIVPADNQNPLVDPTQERPPPFASWTTFSGAENAVTNGPLLPYQFDNTIPNSVHGDSREARLFETPRITEFPPDLPDLTFEGVDDSDIADYTYRSASDDRGIWSDGNCSVADNAGETSTTVFLVNGAETAANRIVAPSSENQTTHVLVPRSESVTLVSQRRRSIPDLPGYDCLASNEQASKFRGEKRTRTDEELDNTRAVKSLGACFFCRWKKIKVSCILL